VKPKGRKLNFKVGQVVRVIKNTTAELRSKAESRAIRGDFLTLVDIQPLVGEWWCGKVRLRRDEIRPLTKLEGGFDLEAHERDLERRSGCGTP